MGLRRSFFNYLYFYLSHSIITARYGFHNKPNRPLIAFHIRVLEQDNIPFLKVSFFLCPLSPYLQCCKIVSPPCLPESLSQTLNLSPFFLEEVLHIKVSKTADTVLAFCVRSIEGDRTSNVSGSEEIGSKGLAFIIAMTSNIRVVKTSLQQCIKNASCRVDHPFPSSSHMGRVGSVK
ncbi:hypothetical protein PDJAM_G00258550 [Pangasius djambal]|uniref:Uncharacterized protein n=1 Tax=Pangasius djambal TaxID=1691987 RepID=A0ACC5YKZ4_9TELE|nr:hypothetical protein [Pangasius djambal]